MSYEIVGACGRCGGRVTVPHVWHGVVDPTPTCHVCGAVAADDLGLPLPVLPMRNPPRTWTGAGTEAWMRDQVAVQQSISSDTFAAKAHASTPTKVGAGDGLSLPPQEPIHVEDFEAKIRESMKRVHALVAEHERRLRETLDRLSKR